jgi:hypothetical protein
MPLGMNNETATYLIKIARLENNLFIQIEGSNNYRVTKCLMILAMKFKKYASQFKFVLHNLLYLLTKITLVLKAGRLMTH